MFAFGMSLDLTRARRFLWTIVRHFADVNDGEFGRGISVSAERPRFAGGDVFRHEDTLIRQSRLLGTDEQGVVFALDVENGVGDVGNFQRQISLSASYEPPTQSEQYISASSASYAPD